MRRYSLPRSLFHVEVTENALVENAGLIQDGVQRFRELGYEVWLDDFGSGYSSLNVLKDYKFDELNLKGLSTWERAEALISVAHPDFREQLIADAEKMHIWRRSNK